MDPRLKLSYYEDNNWEDEYIKEAKDVVKQIWEEEYKKFNLVNEQVAEIEDELFSHFFKKRKISQKDELEEYLKEPVVPCSTNILLWWKVYFIINNLFIYFIFNITFINFNFIS